MLLILTMTAGGECCETAHGSAHDLLEEVAEEAGFTAGAATFEDFIDRGAQGRISIEIVARGRRRPVSLGDVREAARSAHAELALMARTAAPRG